jgi:hypothetical protein
MEKKDASSIEIEAFKLLGDRNDNTYVANFPLSYNIYEFFLFFEQYAFLPLKAYLFFELGFE